MLPASVVESLRSEKSSVTWRRNAKWLSEGARSSRSAMGICPFYRTDPEPRHERCDRSNAAAQPWCGGPDGVSGFTSSQGLLSGAWRCRRLPEYAAVGQRDVDEQASGIAVLHRSHGHRDLVARLDGLRRPAGARQVGRGGHFDRPQFGLSLVVGDVDVHPRVRIRPLEFLQDAADGDGLGLVDAGGGMMRHLRRRAQRDDHQRACDNERFHHVLSPSTTDRCDQRTLSVDWVLGMCWFRSGRHDTSAMSVSSTRVHRFVTFQSPSQFLGSVIVYALSSVLPLFTSLMRSTMCSWSLAGMPVSIQW